MRTFTTCRLIQRHIFNLLCSVAPLIVLVLLSFTGYSQCTIYNVSSTGSATICTGATGPTVTLDNSVTGVNYQLKRGTTNVGSIQAGVTGTALNWINNNTAGTYTITASKSTAPTCSATMNGSIVVTVNTLPTAPTVTGASRCGAGTLSLTASSTVSGTFNLYAASTGGSPLQTNSTSATSYTFTTPSLSATTVYYVTFSNGTCESSPRKSVTATVNTIPTITSVTGGSTCGTGTVPIQVNGSAAGTFKLYAALTGGSALSTSPASLTSHTFTSPSINATKTYYVTTTTSGCESTPRTSVVATVAPPQLFTVSGGGGLTSLNTSVTINLSGSQPSVNYQLKLNGVNSGTVVAGNSSPLSWTVSSSGTYSVVALLGTCTTTMGSVTVTNGYVDDAVEYAALKDLFLSTTGTGWINKANWPTSWPASATSAEFGTWFGVGVSEGDVVSLMLYSNKLKGTLPNSIGNLGSLYSINMQSNQLSGTFPSSLSNANKLSHLIFQDNQFTGPLPAWSGTDLPFLQILYFNINQFSGTIPPSYATFPSMSQLFLYGNQLTGTLPSEFATMTWLQDFRPGGNPFTPGPVPSWLGQMSGLTTLLLGGSNFTGTIPSSLSSLHNLTYLGLDGNQLTGGLDGLKGCTSITTLILSYNQLNDMSTDLSPLTHLSYLQLNNNQFQGPLPEWFGELTSLSNLYLNSNQFTLLPASFGKLEHLANLYLQDNQFKGNLPDVSRMTNLRYVNVANNQFTGSLPSSFSIPNIIVLDASLNQLSGPFPSISNWTNITSLSITGNQFSGAFPSATGLNKLTYLEATSNRFTSFPTSLLKLPLISYVSFQGNQLTKIDNLEAEVAVNSLHPPSSLGIVFIDRNQLDFTTIGSLSSLNFPLFALPQNEINDVKIVGFNVNSALSVPSHPLQPTTTISWEKIIGATWTDVTASSEDATHKTFQLSHATAQDAGTYRWKMTDSQFPNAVINSSGIEVKTNIQITVDSYAFQYNYDDRQRMTHKKVPGADWVYMVYDNRDRLVLTQDGNQRLKDQWTFTKYDVLNRPVINGIYTHSTAVDQTTMQGIVNDFYGNLNGDKSWFESFSTSIDQVHNYDNKSFPQITDPSSCLNVTYYDNYQFRDSWETSYNPVASDLMAVAVNGVNYDQVSQFDRVIGQVTGTKIRTIDATNSNFKYLKTVTYYDDKYRAVQVISDNNEGAVDRTTLINDFVGKVLKTKTTHQTSVIQWKDTQEASLTANSAASASVASNPKSTLTLPANTDGWIEFKAEQLGIPLATVGFLPEDGTEGFHFIVMQQGASIKENGITVASYYPRKSHYPLRIARIGNTVTFYVNNNLFYTSLRSSFSALRLNVYVDSNSGIADIRTSFASVSMQHTSERTFTYDHAGRLLTTWQSIDGASPILLSKNEYNEVGQLVTKKLHSTNNGNSFKQHEDYRYNIRGWLTRINNADLNITDGGPKDFFGMELGYNNDLGIGTFTPQYNGNISATKWSANLGLGLSFLTEPTQRAYKFTYDPLNRLREADFTTKVNSWTSSSAHRESIDFDLNGNITALQRNNERGAAMDLLTYKYGEGNQLKSITDQGIITQGFRDDNTINDDYAYDKNGNMKQDKNKRFQDIKYNSYLNLKQQIESNNGEKVKYIYSADGVKIGEEIYTAGSSKPIKRISYVGPFVYENDTLKFVLHDEGKIIMPRPGASDPSQEYQYQIKDHLDNIRATFTTKTKTDEFKATMEDTGIADYSNPRVQQMAYFGNLFETEIRNVNQWLNHSSYEIGNAVYLDGSELKTIGPYTMLKVCPGDTVKMEVFAKYENKSSYSTIPMTTLLAMMMGPIQAAAVGIDGGSALRPLSITNGLFPLLANKGSSNTTPAVYLNYILFDKNFKVADLGFDRINESCGFETLGEASVSFDKMALERIIDRAGYLYVYVSNESPGTRVWMDDLTLTYSQSPVVQFEDYYPLGLSISETAFERDNDKYKGMVNTDGTGLKDLGFRQYDAATGRFDAVDPLGELQADQSTYQYAGNNPVNQIDVLGLDQEDPDKRRKHKETRMVNGKKVKVHNGYENRQQQRSAQAANRHERQQARAERREQGDKKREENAKKREERNKNEAQGESTSATAYIDIGTNPFHPQKEEDHQSGALNGQNSDLIERREGVHNNIVVAEIYYKASPISLVRSYEIAQRNPGTDRTRQYLYSNHPINEARALYQRTLITRNDNNYLTASLKQTVALLANTTTNDDIFYQKEMQPPPTSTPAEAVAAIPATLQQSTHFPNVDPNKFLDQLEARVSEGGHEGTNQGAGTNFCWAAAIVKHGYDKDPKGMVDAMIGLYQNGTFVYDNNNGGMNVPEASQAARDAVGSDVFDNNQDEKLGQTINELDQMLFMTIADHYKGYTNVVDLNYDPGNEEGLWAGGVLNKAIEVWQDFGFDIEVTGSDLGWASSGDNKIKAVTEAIETSDVVLYVNSGAFKRNEQISNVTATHYIHIVSIQQVGDEYKIIYWDYGRVQEAITMDADQFFWAVYGMIEIPRTND